MKTCPNLGSSTSSDSKSCRRGRSTRTKFALRFIRSLMEMKKRGYNVSNNSSADKRSKRIKVAADSSMARAVGPRRAWARALLVKLQRREKRRRVLMNVTRKNRSCLVLKKNKNKKKNKKKRVTGCDDVVLSQTDKLRGLVPGGKAMDICSLFEETAHYIKCLATQVKVMQGIADQLSST